MELPKPVDVASLGFLTKARQVMNVVESRTPEKKATRGKDFDPRDTYNQSMFGDDIMMRQSQANAQLYSESDEREPIYENQQSTPQGITQNLDYTPEQIMASNLPLVVKEAMLKNPIPRLSGPPSKVSAEAIAKLTGAKIRTPQQQSQRQVINESRSNYDDDMITVSKSQLQEMINESINTFFKQTYNKTVTEETIKKTINLLIKEGKIQTKRKI
jgi:hypothetical protein